MIALFLITIGLFFEESSTAIGKRAVANKLETIFSYGFLNLFWTLIFYMLAVLLLHRSFYFNPHSLPFFIPRSILDITLSYLGVRAIAAADRSTYAFLRLISIPLLLMIDIILGYHISPLEIIGMMLIFVSLVFLIGHHTINKKGSGLVIATALIAPITLSLYKYDITHYNSVAAEQSLLTMAELAFFTVAAWYHGREKTWNYLLKEKPELQSMLQGLGSTLVAYSYAYVPASIALTFNRLMATVWAIIFGNVYFHEKKLRQKLAGYGVMLLALILIAVGTR
jgi:hypothetical protein